MEKIKEKISNLQNEEKLEVISKFNLLLYEFLPSSGLTEPHFLFIDNSVLQDIKKQSCNKESYLNYLSVCLFANFISHRSYLDARIALPPAILYEFAGRQPLNTEQHFQSILRDARDCLGVFDLDVYSIGYDSFKAAQKLFLSIRHDEREIVKAINRINTEDWRISPKEGTKTNIPFILARKMVPTNVRLKYFKRGYVHWILSCLIEREILTHKENDPRVRKKFHNEFVITLASLTKFKHGLLKGLGDIELLQYCDITSQFQARARSTSTAITFDRNLAKTLSKRTTLPVSHEPIRFGIDSEKDLARKLQQLSTGKELLDSINERQLGFQEKAADFYNHLKEVFA